MYHSERPSKRNAFLALLREGWVSLHLDARRQGVVVPAPFSSQAHLVLQYGHEMPIPISDLEVTDAGVSATLSFSRVPHRTYIPWSAVYAVTCDDGSGEIYREDAPGDVAMNTPSPEAGDKSPLEKLLPQSLDSELQGPVPWLRAVPPEESIESEGMVMQVHSRRRRPQLRVVK
jgi:stringent starvation protein B